VADSCVEYATSFVASGSDDVVTDTAAATRSDSDRDDVFP
jgi:hypothetical protein